MLWLSLSSSLLCSVVPFERPKMARPCGVFYHFDFEMCCSEPGVLCTCWLRNMLHATTACTFTSLIWPDGSAPAALGGLPFDPPEPPNHWKNTLFRDCATFSRTDLHLLSSASFSSLIFFLLLFSSLSDSSHTSSFSSVYIVGSLTSKLPSLMYCT